MVSRRARAGRWRQDGKATPVNAVSEAVSVSSPIGVERRDTNMDGKLVCAQLRAKGRFWWYDPLACAMPTIHCHLCGGFIANPAGTTYRTPDAAKGPAIPRSALCLCDHPVVYGTAEPGPALRDVRHIRSASRN